MKSRYLIFCLGVLILGSSTSVIGELMRGEDRRTDQNNKPAEEVVALSVEGPRPVRDAMEILTSRYRWVITYEDPRYVCESDVVDHTVRPDLGLALDPKGGKLEIGYSVSSKTGKPEDPAALIEWLLDAHAARGNPGVFRLEQAGEIFHVIPAKVKNKDGRLVETSSILDSKITFPEEDRTGMETLRVICTAVSQVTKTKIMLGTIPINLFAYYRTRQGAANESARSVLVRTLEGTGRKLSWRLLYGPGRDTYALNVRVISNPPPTPGHGIGTGRP